MLLTMAVLIAVGMAVYIVFPLLSAETAGGPIPAIPNRQGRVPLSPFLWRKGGILRTPKDEFIRSETWYSLIKHGP